jgi:hypothetical protein
MLLTSSINKHGVYYVLCLTKACLVAWKSSTKEAVPQYSREARAFVHMSRASSTTRDAACTRSVRPHTSAACCRMCLKPDLELQPVQLQP